MSVPGWRNIKIKVIQSSPPGSIIRVRDSIGRWQHSSNESDSPSWCNIRHDDKNLHNKDRSDHNKQLSDNQSRYNIQCKKGFRNSIHQPHNKSQWDNANHCDKGYLAWVVGFLG